MTPRRRNEELADLEAALRAAPQDVGGESFGLQVMRDSLLRRHEEVMTDAAGALSLALRGETAGITGAEVSVVAKVLESLQESLASIAQVLAGEPTSRGLIPGAIKELVQLRVAEATPGSLQLRLVPASLPPEPAIPSQPTLTEAVDPDDPEAEEAPLLDQSIERLIGLLAYGEDEREHLLQDIADVGPRTTTHLQSLSKALVEGGVSASLSWRSPSTERSTSLSHEAARRLTRTLEEVEETSREVVYTGRIVGGSLIHRTFELQLEGDEASLVAGKVTEQVLSDLERLFGQLCTAHIEVREAMLPSGETREAHLLTQLTD